MILIGVLLIIFGLIFGITLMWVAGIVLVVLGAIFARTSTGPFNGRWY